MAANGYPLTCTNNQLIRAAIAMGPLARRLRADQTGGTPPVTLSQDDEDLITELEREMAARPIDFAHERDLRDWTDQKARINHTLTQGKPEVLEQYAMLRDRTTRLLRLMDIDAPKQLVDSERRLIGQSLAAIDSRWTEIGP